MVAKVVIKNLLPKPRPIQVSVDDAGEPVYLDTHGISLDQTVLLLDKYGPELTKFFGSKAADGSAMDFGLLITTAPAMVASIIAIGVDAVGQEEDITKMVVQTQIELLNEIWDQSVPNIKKLLELVIRAGEKLKQSDIQLPSNLLSPRLSMNSSVPGTVRTSSSA